MVQKLPAEESQSNGLVNHVPSYVGSGKDYAMAFSVNDVADLAVGNVTSIELPSRIHNGRLNFRPDLRAKGIDFQQAREQLSRPTPKFQATKHVANEFFSDGFQPKRPKSTFHWAGAAIRHGINS